MRAEPGTVLHFSEDPDLRRFVPHVARTAAERLPYVWAVDAANSPSYWFPRQCPRGLAWVGPGTTEADRWSLLGPSAQRVHVVEYAWLARLQAARLYAYPFDAAEFRPYGEPEPHAQVADHAVTPLGPPRPVGDLLRLHEEAAIELRLVHDLWPWWRAVTRSTVAHSGIRLGNARPPAPV